MAKVKVEFISDVHWRDAESREKFSYASGQVATISADQYEKWQRRGICKKTTRKG